MCLASISLAMVPEHSHTLCFSVLGTAVSFLATAHSKVSLTGWWRCQRKASPERYMHGMKLRRPKFTNKPISQSA